MTKGTALLLKPPKVGLKYPMKDGPYKGRLVKILELMGTTYLAKVMICGPWGEDTAQTDHVKTNHVDYSFK